MSAYDWELSATCRRPGIDPDAWYPTIGQSPEPAKTICWDHCPVRAACLDAALAEEHPANPRRVPRWGIRGGLDAAERAEEQRRRTLRKHAAARQAATTPAP